MRQGRNKSDLSAMEIPQHVKERVRTVLQSRMMVGIPIDHVREEYQRLMNHPLPIRELGYTSLVTFLRSMPDVARLEYSVREQCMKVYGVTSFNFHMDLRHQNGQGRPLLATPSRKIDEYDVKAGSRQGPSRPDGGNLDVTPDPRGVYTLCFPSWKKPAEFFGTLQDMFGVAGKVFEVYETSRWIYVCYTDYHSVQRAFKMFGHLGLKAATEMGLKMAKSQSDGGKRKLESDQLTSTTSSLSGIPPRKRKKVLTGGSQRVYVGNLNPSVKYTFDMFRKLFHKYRLAWISLKSVEAEGNDPITFAIVLATNIKDAESMVKEFNGYVWFGQPLFLALKEKHAEKWETNSSLPSNDRDDSFYGKKEMGKHGPVARMPGLEPAMPGLEPAMPGLELAMPGLEPAMPELEPALPGLEPFLPPVEPARPRMKSLLQPRFQRLERRGPSENLHVQNNFETPTLLVANIKDVVDEASLRSLFAVYHPSKIRMSRSTFGRKKAYIEVRSVEDVKQAVKNLNHHHYHGLKLKVDVPYNRPQMRKALGLDCASKTSGAVTLSVVLRTRGIIIQALHVPDFNCHLGQKLEVLITDVISDKFFWGQLTHTRMTEDLQRVSDHLNANPALELHRNIGTGRCKARFHEDGKWYRAWVMSSQLSNNHCRVFYLDYGNTALVPWSHTAKVLESWVWDVPPLAIPFTLIEDVPGLKNRALTRITVEVNAFGSMEEGNMVVVRAVSLAPADTEAMSCIMRTVLI